MTEFLVHDVDPLVILRQMTHMFDLKMLIRRLSGDQVRVRALSDVPKELFMDENFGPQVSRGRISLACLPQRPLM